MHVSAYHGAEVHGRSAGLTKGDQFADSGPFNVISPFSFADLAQSFDPHGTVSHFLRASIEMRWLTIEVAKMRLIRVAERHHLGDPIACKRQIIIATIVGILCVLALWKLAVWLGAFPH